MEKENFDLEKIVQRAAEFMAAAAKTAPKAKGENNLVIHIFKGDRLRNLATLTEETGKETSRPQTFSRDAKSLRKAAAVLIIGTISRNLGLDCSFCGRASCTQAAKEGITCAYNSSDLGIAVGSAVSRASDFRIDNRIMYTVGYTVKKHNLLGENIRMALGIPLSATGKNPFFDR